MNAGYHFTVYDLICVFVSLSVFNVFIMLNMLSLFNQLIFACSPIITLGP